MNGAFEPKRPLHYLGWTTVCQLFKQVDKYAITARLDNSKSVASDVKYAIIVASQYQRCDKDCNSTLPALTIRKNEGSGLFWLAKTRSIEFHFCQRGLT